MWKKIKAFFSRPTKGEDALSKFFEGRTVGEVLSTMNSEQTYLTYTVCTDKKLEELLRTLVIYKLKEEYGYDNA